MITGRAIVTGIVGWPVSHSLSPRLHQLWNERYQLDAAYVPLPVEPQYIKESILVLGRMGFRGCNITVPHKQAVMQAVDEIDDVARTIGAINTIVWSEDGTSIGRNTDAYGFMQSIRHAHPSIEPYMKHAVVLGAGGAARAVVAALLQEGAQHITIINRSVDRASALAHDMKANLHVNEWNSLSAQLESATCLINTTSLGMKGQPPLECDVSSLSHSALVCDIVYSPLKTTLLNDAAARGNPTVTGIGMLAYQAAKAYEYWHGIMPQIDDALLEQMVKWSEAA